MSANRVINQRPLIFSQELARAIRDGRKTETRRLVAPSLQCAPEHTIRMITVAVKCPYGNAGDKLAVGYLDHYDTFTWVCDAEITEVITERLHDITEEGAIAEGCHGQAFGAGPDGAEGILPLESFEMLWDSLDLTRKWDDNPIVWVVKFDLLKMPRGNDEAEAAKEA